MLNLKRFFSSGTHAIALSKPEKELLEFFVARKADFENWSLFHQHQKIRFQFYYPTALEFYFDEFLLFTAYFKRNAFGELELQQLKMSETNRSSLNCAVWAPFAKVISSFQAHFEEHNKTAVRQKNMPLQEYEALCEKLTLPGKERQFNHEAGQALLTQ